MRRAVGCVVALLALPLVGCAGPDRTPVPTEASGDMACDGVPRAGVELVLGGPVVVQRDHGQWGAEESGFQCDVVAAGGGTALVAVEEWDVRTRYGGSDESVVDLLGAQGGAEAIEAAAPGAGFVTGGDGADASAGWVCGGRVLTVALLGVTTAGRDQRADAERLLVSMLPWACGDEDAPPRTRD